MQEFKLLRELPLGRCDATAVAFDGETTGPRKFSQSGNVGTCRLCATNIFSDREAEGAMRKIAPQKELLKLPNPIYKSIQVTIT